MRSEIAIVIPCYNHASLLRRTLESLVCQTLQPKEVVVIDDGSQDNPKAVIDEFIQRLPLRYVRFEQNRGAPAARNEGARLTTSPLLLFLDADAELIPQALSLMAEALQLHPEASFAYGSFLWGKKMFRGKPFSVEDLRQVNYIHTSSLLRREAFPGFDETLKKFQDWDVWLTLAKRGRLGVWIDRVLFRIEPEGGTMSRWLPKIVHKIPWPMFGYMPREIRKYRVGEAIIRKKHGTEVPPLTPSRLGGGSELDSPPSLGGAGGGMFFRQSRWLLWLIAMFILEMASLGTVFWPSANLIATLICGVLMLGVAIFRPATGLALLLGELAIGSKGALLKIPHGADIDGGVSLRIILVVAFLFGWSLNAFWYWRSRRAEFVLFCRDILRQDKAWFALLFLCAWGVVRGLMLHNPFVIADANAWGFLILLFPVIDMARRDGTRLRDQAAQIFIAALVWLPVKTLIILYAASHQISSASLTLYLWVRRTGVGEVTMVSANLFRIFIQSQVYALAAFLGGLAWFIEKKEGVSKEPPSFIFLLMTLSCISILISLSRSFWLGLMAGLISLALIATHHTWKRALRISGIGLASVVTALVVMGAVITFPFPHVDQASLTSLFSSRGSTSDAAAKSRWNLLPIMWQKIKRAPILGSGFGATVTYESKDPRILKSPSHGIYTTYAFEWGWLDHWLKLGIFGIPVMLWLVLSLMWRVWKTEEAWWIRAGFVSSLIALAVLHFFTPYLNHPLGFGFLLAAEGMIRIKKETRHQDIVSVSS